MANTLARMERDGLIEHRQDPDDGRAQRIWLTGAARALSGPATTAAEAVNAQALIGLTPDERATFLYLIRKAITSLQMKTIATKE
jgi:DNA-binding MarR family transcriptional regulator